MARTSKSTAKKKRARQASVKPRPTTKESAERHLSAPTAGLRRVRVGYKLSPDELQLELALADVTARGYDPESARLLIEYFANRLDEQNRRKPLSACEAGVLCDYTGHAFRLIHRGKKAGVALGIDPGPGARPEDNEARNLMFAASVVLLMREGETWEDAIGEIANRFFSDGSGETAVRDAYAKFHYSIEGIADEHIQTLAELTREDLDAMSDTPVK